MDVRTLIWILFIILICFYVPGAGIAKKSNAQDNRSQDHPTESPSPQQNGEQPGGCFSGRRNKNETLWRSSIPKTSAPIDCPGKSAKAGFKPRARRKVSWLKVHRFLTARFLIRTSIKRKSVSANEGVKDNRRYPFKLKEALLHRLSLVEEILMKCRRRRRAVSSSIGLRLQHELNGVSRFLFEQNFPVVGII